MPDFVVPEADAAQDAGIVGGDTDVVSETFNTDVGGVSATEIQHVIMQQGLNDLDRSKNAAIPFFGAMRVAGLVADVVVIGIALMDRVMGQLEVGREAAVAEHRAAHPRTKRQDDFKSGSGHDAQTLNFRVIEETCRLAEALR